MCIVLLGLRMDPLSLREEMIVQCMCGMQSTAHLCLPLSTVVIQVTCGMLLGPLMGYILPQVAVTIRSMYGRL